LFDDVVQVGTISNVDGIVSTVIEFVIHAHAPQSGMGGLEAIQGNYSRLAVAGCRRTLTGARRSPACSRLNNTAEPLTSCGSTVAGPS
jgi:hypothetical protein